VLGAAISLCAAQETTATYSVKGVVLDSVSHQPIARTLVDANSDAVLTDNEGHFELNLLAGTSPIRLSRPGYTSRGRGSEHLVTVGANMPDLTFYLTPEAMIAGHVTLSTGDEADGIRIMAYRKSAVNGRERWLQQGTVTTNSEGAFRLANLDAPGVYLLYSMPVHERVGPIAPGAFGYGYPSLYYPGVADFRGAGMITLLPGQQAEADFALTRQPFYPVSIAVGNHTEGRGMGVQIHDSSGRVVESGTRWNAQLGTAEINLPSGHYYAVSRTGGETALYGRVDFTVAGAAVQGLSMAMLPLHPVPVAVRKEFAASSSGALGVVLGGAGSGQDIINAGLNLTLASADEFDPQMGNGALRHMEGSSDPSLFELENVLPGRYWVETSAFEGYVSSISSGGVDLAREPLVIGAGNTTAPIEITLRDDAGTIKGQINQSPDAAPMAAGETSRIYIYAIPLFSTTSRMAQGWAQADGQFSMGNLAPGSYQVIAVDQAQQIDPNDPQVLGRYSGKGQTVAVEANGTANVQLDVIRSGEEASAP
jgi:hypothetical protein